MNLNYKLIENKKNENYSITVIKLTINIYPINISDIKGEIFIFYNNKICYTNFIKNC